MSEPGTLPATLPSQAPLRRRAHYGPFARWLLNLMFGPVAFPEESRTLLASAAQQGTVVYVLRSPALINLLYLNWSFWRLGLPLARAATGLGYRIFAPFARWYLGGEQVRPPEGATDRAAAQVVEAVRQGESAMVFLRMPKTFSSAVARLSDPFPELVALQRKDPHRRILFAPVTLLWRRRPKKLRGGVRDFLFGDPEEPGAIRSVFSFLFHRGQPVLKLSAPIDLSPVAGENPAADDESVARRVRGALYHHLAREARVVTGPPLKSPERVAEQTLHDLQLRRIIEEIAREKNVPTEQLERTARKHLRAIAARYTPFAVDVLKAIVGWMFTRIYDGVDVDEAGMQKVALAGAHAPLVLCPSHKSHFDYMVMSVVCDDYGLQPPHVAAGDNLNFWPVGRLLRMGGAFFIRRSFKGDRIYGAVMAAYVKRLLTDRFTQEFFIEGGRSRTGKLLPPKFGLLTLEVDGWLSGVRDDAMFAPISISYEKIPEARSYQQELLGGEKQKEDARALLSATKVLRSRFGRITIRFDDPISLRRVFEERGIDPGNHTPEERRALVRALGLRIAAGINRAMPVAPVGLVSAVLLSHDRRGMSEDELLSRCEFLHQAALDGGARTPAWQTSAGRGPEDTVTAPPASLRDSGLVQRALRSLTADGHLKSHEAGGERFYSVVEERRMALDYHKNSILHFLVAPAILALALRSFGAQRASIAAVLARARELSQDLKYEFIFEPGKTLESAVEETLAHLVRWGIVERQGDDAVPVASGLRMSQLLADLLRPYLEGLWVAVDALELLQPGPMSSREWTQKALDRGRAAFFAGRIRRIESLSKATLENGISVLRDREVIRGAKVELTPEWRSRDRIVQLAEEVDRYLV
ncbi:MAG: 1-acyl-sn-glycerol-3-phosphate acyltransferase [Myxococcales bacterium]